ncbi:hypothetical protein [Solilutibacter silvestris]|uniref:Uncharacterized protein n=1 Tax=Solilutibacter silvestris TaxID=1645665 RepID=A0A2K1Q3W1_9GAMM|nr:hypothetical protein [Lysobacter silvestris]PNS09742.1 hypothetical protein Lysil_1371 [Lysobacter silvestris]
MKTFIAFLLLAIPSLGLTQEADRCPILPDSSGVEWSYQEGPDFDLCYAMDAKSKKDLFGVYTGFFPSFKPETSSPIGEGIVAGQKIQWYPASGEHAEQFSKQTVLHVDGKILMHVWISADNEADAKLAQEVLSKMKFRP